MCCCKGYLSCYNALVIPVLYFTDMDNQEVSRTSRGLHAVVNDIIGDPVVIDIRRTTTNLRDHILRRECELGNTQCVVVYSGSRAEGLRFRSSDDDWMCLYRGIKVIPSDSYMTIYDSNTTLLLMENEMTKPGFTLLKRIGESTNQWVIRSTESILNGRYLSCKRWRELHTGFYFGHAFTHGPCTSGTRGPHEFDFAFCLQCDFWPTNAQDCIRRLHQCCWPSHDTILSIVNDGVLFVPIGAKQSIFENTEWRMSFSLAEKKLIHAMNHTQFLCYGLLKIFLKEAIDAYPENKGLLCSYFLKTSLFWEITTAVNLWNSSTLLPCFWKCFNRILQWVSCSYCPNFFTPQNNMFAGKIQGTNRDKLLRHLGTLHSEGYRCLLRCRSVAEYMSPITFRPTVALSSEPSNSWIAVNIMIEWSNLLQRLIFNYEKDTKRIRCFILHQLAITVSNSHQRFLLRNWLGRTLIPICMSESNDILAQGLCNRSHYGNLTKRLKMMQRFAVGSFGPMLYQAMLCYKAGKYNQALRLVQLSKEKMSSPVSIYYGHHRKVTEAEYRQAGGENLPIATMLRRHIILDIVVENDQYIPELYIEGHGSNKDFVLSPIANPPIISAFFLQYLCQKRLGCQLEADEALYELSLLVQHDDGQYIHELLRGISWQLLGICQQMNGDDSAACRSYLTALQQDNIVELTVASCIRLGTILVKYF